MGIEISHKAQEWNLTAIAGGAVGAFAMERAGHNITQSMGMKVVADATGATVGGRMKRVPEFLGRILGSATARTAGGDTTAAALAAHTGGKIAQVAPQAQAALGELSKTADHALARGAAKVGETALGEAPGAIGAVLGAKGANTIARGLTVALAVGGAAAGAALAGTVLPKVSWTTGA